MGKRRKVVPQKTTKLKIAKPKTAKLKIIKPKTKTLLAKEIGKLLGAEKSYSVDVTYSPIGLVIFRRKKRRIKKAYVARKKWRTILKPATKPDSFSEEDIQKAIKKLPTKRKVGGRLKK